MLTIFLLLGFVNQTQKNQTIVIPKAIQLAGFGLIILWILSLFFKERKDTFNNTAFEKRQESLYNSLDVGLPDFEKMTEMSTEQLLQLLQQAEATGNKVLADLIRDILISRFSEGEAIDLLNLIPKGTYVAVLLESFGGTCWLMIIQSPEYLIPLREQEYYIGETTISLNDGMFEIKDEVFLQAESEYEPGKIRTLIGWFMEDLGFTPK